MSAATMWGLIGGCALMTALIKGAGPVALGGRELPPWFGAIVELMRFGIATARRAWLTPAQVANTRSWAELQPLRKRSRAAA